MKRTVMYMKKYFAKAFTAILFAGILTVPSCSLWEEDTDPSEREGNGPGELIEYSCSLSPADFETKTVGVDDLPSYYIVGVYDITGTKVGVITNSSSLALYKYAKYSFYAVGGAVTDYTFPMSESDIVDLPVWYSWSGDSPDAPSVGISENGAPVYGKVKGVTPASIASGTVLHIPVERKVAKFNLTVKTDSALRKYFNAPTISLQLCNANIGFFTESTTYTTNGEDAMSRYNSLVDDIYSGDGPTFTGASSSMSAAGSSPNLYYTWNSVFAVPENMNGSILAGNTDPSLKNKDSLDALDTPPSGVTYLDLAVTYSGSYGVSGTMHYRFYPGADNTSNFDIEGGKTYNITCNLSYNGVFADAEWKIDTGSMTDVRTFDLQYQTHNTVKGDTLWVKIGYAQGGAYDYSVTPYSAKKFGIFVNNTDAATSWYENNISDPYVTNPIVNPSYVTKTRRSATCITCGNVFHGWPPKGSNNSYVFSWLPKHLVPGGSLSYQCPACGTTLFTIANMTAAYALANANDGATFNGKITIGYASNYYAFAVSASETRHSFHIDLVSYDGKQWAQAECPLGPITYLPISLTGDFAFHVAQKRTMTMDVSRLPASGRSSVTFRATLDDGEGTSDVSSWLSSSLSGTTWTVTMSAKASGTVTVEALDGSSDVIGSVDIKVRKPMLVVRNDVTLYPSGESFAPTWEYKSADGRSMTVNASPVDQPYYFDSSLFASYLNCSCSTSMLSSSYNSLLTITKSGTPKSSFAFKVTSFNGSTMQTILNTESNVIKIGTYTLTNGIGSSGTRDIYIKNFSATERNDPNLCYGGSYTFDVEKSYAGAIQFRYYWKPYNGRSSSSATNTSVNDPSVNPNLVISYNKTAGTVTVPSVYGNGIGMAYLYAFITNSVSAETVLVNIRQINIMRKVSFSFSKIHIEDIGLLIDDQWRFWYDDGLSFDFTYGGTDYSVKIGIRDDDYGSIPYIKETSNSNQILNYPNEIGEWNKEFYPADTGVEAVSIFELHNSTYLFSSSTVPSAAKAYLETTSMDKFQGWQ